ncbi:hypothetical protein JCM5353_006183, partial [Sporobolomyces roseus]
LSTSTVLSYTVPTSYPISSLSPPSLLAQEDHALYSQTLFPTSTSTTTSTGFILSRIIEDGYTLELRWISTTHQESQGEFEELDKHPATLTSVRFIFPSRLIPLPSLTYSEESLQVCAITEAGMLYTLNFDTKGGLFYDGLIATTEEEWSEEFWVEGLQGKEPVLMKGVEEGRVIVACADGSSLVVEIAEGQDGALIETELKSPSSFSIRSLVPSFSRRDLSSTSSATQSSSSPLKLVSGHCSTSSSPSQLVSLAITTPSETQEINSSFAFGVSRDRKLKVWNVETGNCLRSIDLPKSTASSSSSSSSTSLVSRENSFDSPHSQHPQSSLLLPPTPQSFVKITSSSSSTSPYSSYLTLFTPPSANSQTSTFFIYGLATDTQTGELSQLAPVAEKIVDHQRAGMSLIDFEIGRLELGGKERWTLWTVWEEGGETEMRTCGLSELDEEEEEEEAEGQRWTILSKGGADQSTTSSWTAAYFDQQLSGFNLGDHQAVQETFLKHVSTPGRYPPASFEYALEMYEQVILNELDQQGLNGPEAFEQEYETSLIRSAAIVASHVELGYSNQTGAPLKEEYTKRIKLEWLRFVALLNESRSQALFPTALAVDGERGLVFVLGRDSIMAPVEEELVQSLHQSLTSTTNLVGLFPNYPESNFPLLLQLIKSLSSRLSIPTSRTFESALLERLRTPFTTDIEDISLDLFESTLEAELGQQELENCLEGLKGFVEPSKTIEAFCRLLLSTSQSPSQSQQGGGGVESTDLSQSLLADYLTTSIRSRYELARGLVLVLITAWGAADEEGSEVPMASFDQTTSFAFSTLHSLSTLHWTATQIVTPTFEAVEALRKPKEGDHGEGGLDEKFGALKMAASTPRDGAEVLPVPTYSLLSSLLRIPSYSPSLPPSTYAALPSALASAASSFLSSPGLLTTKPLIDSTAEEVKFVFTLVELGMNEQAKELMIGLGASAGGSYVIGRAELGLGNGEEAQKHFERAASGLYALDSISSDSSLAAGGLSSILSSSTISSLSSYYIHLVSLFVPTLFDYSLARFAQLALDALDEEGSEDEETAKDLWTKLFRSWASIGEYEKAYQAIMYTPYHETKTTCLAHFISLVCENGATSLLTTLSFVGLEGDLERNLAFRARNSDPLAQPDYYKVLYAYHVSKGDYRSAGTVMYQQARRIGELNARGGPSYRNLATVQCQSYLAAANALSLVSREHAWVAIVADENVERGNKRRKIAYHIPDDEYDPSASRPLEMRELADIRREYTIALARLQLSVEFPELERTNFHLEPEAVVALFSQTNAFDQAFNAGRSLDVDLSSLFEIIAEKCVALTIHSEGTEDASWVALSPEASTWEGSLASKAWRLLERHLQRHDSAPVYRYRLVVLERVLATNRDGKIPTFLTDFLLRNQPQSLLKTLIRFDRLSEAFRYSLETIQNSTISPTHFSSHLPYSLFDQLLAIPPGDSPHLSDDVLKQRQQDLREAIEGRVKMVEKATATLKRA